MASQVLAQQEQAAGAAVKVQGPLMTFGERKSAELELARLLLEEDDRQQRSLIAQPMRGNG